MKILILTTIVLIGAASAWAGELQPYESNAFQKAQESGKSIALQFHASWCGACIKQQKSLKQLMEQTAFKDYTVFVADFDREKALKEQLKVTRQSVVLVYKGKNQLDQVTGITDSQGLTKALSKAL